MNILAHEVQSKISEIRKGAKQSLDSFLEEVVKISLQSPDFKYSGFSSAYLFIHYSLDWRSKGSSGRYFAPDAEIEVNLMTADVTWRNDNLKPLPESMTQYSDFKNLFGQEALQCGTIQREERRHWYF